MKCSNCGNEMLDGALFCSQCGVKMLQEVLTCPECGAKLSYGSKFCTDCGVQVATIEKENKAPPTELAQETDNHESVLTEDSRYLEDNGKNAIKEKLQKKWTSLNLFCKISFIGSCIGLLLFIISLLADKTGALALSVFQIALFVAAILIDIGIVKCGNSKYRFIAMVLGVLFTVFVFMAFGSKKIENTKNATEAAQTNLENTSEPSVEAETEDKVMAVEPEETGYPVPMGCDECVGTVFSQVVDSFSKSGFENIELIKIEDLSGSDTEMDRIVERISIDGESNFVKNQKCDPEVNILIEYHDFPAYNISMKIEVENAWLIGAYGLNFKIDGIKQDGLKNGETKELNLQLSRGTHTFLFEKETDKSVTADYTIDVKGDINASLYMYKMPDSITITTQYLEDFGSVGEGQLMIHSDFSEYLNLEYSEADAKIRELGFTNVVLNPDYVDSTGPEIHKVNEILIDGKSGFARGDIFNADTEVTIKYCEDYTLDPIYIAQQQMNAALEEVFPVDMAKKAVLVAMTNCQAPDVFKKDGNTLDPNKFHSYSDISGFFMIIENDGTWNAIDESTWHVDDIVLRIYGFDTYLWASGDLIHEGKNYIFSNVDRAISSSAYDSSSSEYEHFEPSEDNIFLTVSESLLSKGRDEEAAEEKFLERERKQRELEEHKKWVSEQFSPFNGSHKVLTELIKDNLNDSKSFKHVETNYVDVTTEDLKKEVNSLLKNYGYKQRVDIYDLLITETFTAKNAFNATIKSTAIGIVTSDGTVTLIDID